MRHALGRIAFGVLSTGMIAAMTAGATTAAASAAVSAPQHTAAVARPVMLRWPVVRRGDYGERVRTIQYLLDAHGAGLTADGDFGFPTEHAVKHFQRKVHLYPDGVVGNATWRKLIITVRYGCRGYAVQAVQSQLRYAYHQFRLAVDGVFGPKTERAVRHFQYRFRLVPDGIVGPVTWNTMVVHDGHHKHHRHDR